MAEMGKRLLVALALCVVLCQSWVLAQTLGSAPQFNKAVQGQTRAQPALVVARATAAPAGWMPHPNAPPPSPELVPAARSHGRITRKAVARGVERALC
ncbi:MAG: hypothetical protein ABSD56_08385 [Bryobacteraceae bacterium]